MNNRDLAVYAEANGFSLPNDRAQERIRVLESMIADGQDAGAAALLPYVKEYYIKHVEGEAQGQWSHYLVTLMPKLFTHKNCGCFAEVKYSVWEELIRFWLNAPTSSAEVRYLTGLFGQPLQVETRNSDERYTAEYKIRDKMHAILREQIDIYTKKYEVDRLVRALTHKDIIHTKNADFVIALGKAIAKHSNAYQHRIVAEFLEIFGMSTTTTETSALLPEVLAYARKLVAGQAKNT